MLSSLLILFYIYKKEMPSRLGKLVLFLPFKEAKKIQIREGKRHLLKSQLNAAHSSGKRVLSSLLILFYIYKKEMPSRLGKLVLFLPFKEAKKIQIREGKRHLLKSQLKAAHSSGKRVLSSLLILFIYICLHV